MILQNIHNPQDLKKVPQKKLGALAQEMRNKIISTVGKNGGHLASNLGVVELTIALHRVFASPKDAIVWDVSHQCYPHKLITGRYDQFETIRLKDGISGFTKIKESDHDYFDAGHASSSISSAAGLLEGWSLSHRDGKVIAVIGDGALTGGMAFEALSHAGLLNKNLIVVLNDNQMSISRNTGALSLYLSKLSMTRGYQNLRYKFDRALDLLPYFNRTFGKFVYRFKRGLKGLFLTNNLFVDLGFEYVGPLNGHNIAQMEQVFRRVKKIPRPVVVHVVTKKGKGYSPAENDPSVFHGIGPFNISDGKVEKFDTTSFTEAFSRKIVEMGEKDERICAITAAMAKGTGLDVFSRHFRNRFYDVGIAEEHAVTFSGGLAAAGMVPFCAIYSTFIQRSVDQIIEDVALQNRHVIICLDRAGAVGSDGETHQGIFDIALLRCIPNINFLTVSSIKDMNLCMEWAVNKAGGPVVIRWPKATCPSEMDAFSLPVEPGRGLLVTSEDFAPSIESTLEKNARVEKDKVLFVCTGGMFGETLKAARDLLLNNVECHIFTLRFIKPFDNDYFIGIARNYKKVLFVEDGVLNGGIGRELELVLKSCDETKKIKTKVLAFPDSFVPNGTRNEILSGIGLDSTSISREMFNL